MKKIKGIEVILEDVQINFVFFQINVDVDPHATCFAGFPEEKRDLTKLQPREEVLIFMKKPRSSLGVKK